MLHMQMENMPLTAWQEKIMDLVCEGYTNEEIAGMIFCAQSTLQHTLGQYIYPKLKARNRTQAAVIWTRLRN